MRKFIEWYLVEVEGRLTELVSREELHQTLREIEAHLIQQSEANVAAGMNEREAVLSAIESFGTPESYALGVWRESNNVLFGKPAESVAAWSSVGLIALVGLWTLGAILWQGEPSAMILPAVGVGLLYLVAAWRSRRWVLRPAVYAAVGVALLHIVVLGTVVVPHPYWGVAWRSDTRQVAERSRKGVAEMSELRSLVREGRQAFAQATTAEQVPDGWRLDNDRGFATAARISRTEPTDWIGKGAYVVPYGPVQTVLDRTFNTQQRGTMRVSYQVQFEQVREPGPRIALKAVQDLAEAKRVWAGRADGYLSALDGSIASSRAMVASAESGLRSLHLTEPYILQMGASMGLLSFGGVFLLNALALFGARRSRPRSFRLATL